MTNQEIENGLSRIRNSRYSTGVLHIAAPQWLEDLRWCIKVIDFLLRERLMRDKQ